MSRSAVTTGRAWAAAHYLSAAALGVVVCLGVAAVGTQTVDVGLMVPLHTGWFARLGLVLSAGLVLRSQFGELDQTFVRHRLDVVVRLAAFLSLVSIGMWIQSMLREMPSVLGVWTLLLAALHLLGSATRGDLGWVTVLAVGAVSAYWEHSDLSQPLTFALAPLHATVLIPVLAVSALIYLRRA